ncbi:MAG: hypothetical protein BMS9Abin37_0990 [Acidobacteriota bacterium]|nr:MAG: hypothetical protein BMS9Abin37_0990 [Acidobacteriota bacterium]
MPVNFDMLDTLTAHLPSGIIVFRRDGTLLTMDPGFQKLYNAPLDLTLEGYRTLLLSALAKDAPSQSVKTLERSIIEPPAPLDFVLELRARSRRLVAVHCAPALGADGELVGRLALHRDVTKELRFIARARERADLPDINPIPLFKCDTLGRVLFQNDAAKRFLVGLGLDPGKAQRMFPHDYRERIKTAVSEHQGAQVFEHRYKTRMLTFTLSPHPRLPHCMILVDDVTGQRHAEESMKRYAEKLESTNHELRETQMALVQTEKMASLGKLVAGIAHEINTPVGAVSSNADLMRRALTKLRHAIGESQIPENRDLEKALTALEHVASVNREACERIAKIVRELRNFARLDEAERKRVDVHEGIESTLTLLHHELKKRIDVVREFGDLPEIECFPSRLNQVFMNLLVNTIQAIDGKGRITVRTSASDAHVRLEFRDSGRGVPPDVLPQIFDPGFTTKGVGVGSGLGLAICYQIVRKDHGGEISVDSKTGVGTTFTVTLPIRAAF